MILFLVINTSIMEYRFHHKINLRKFVVFGTRCQRNNEETPLFLYLFFLF